MTLRYRAELDTSNLVAGARAGTEAMAGLKAGILDTSSALKKYDGAASRGSGGASGKATGSARAPTRASKTEPPRMGLPDIAKLAGASDMWIDKLEGGLQRLWVASNGTVKSTVGVFDSTKAQYSTAKGLVGKIASEEASAARKTEREKATATRKSAAEQAAAKRKSDASAKQSWSLAMRAYKDDARAQDKAEGDKRIAVTKTLGTVNDYQKKVIKAGVLAAVAVAGAAAGGVAFLAKYAVGYRGMYQLNALTARAGYNFRMLFRGVDPSPVVRSWDKVTALVNPRSFMGATIGAGLTRGFNGLFAVIEKATPYVTAFGKGFYYGFLIAEIAILKARIALKPYMPMIEQLIGKQDGLNTAFLMGTIAFATAAGAIGLVVGAAAVAGAGVLWLGQQIEKVANTISDATDSFGNFMKFSVKAGNPSGLIADWVLGSGGEDQAAAGKASGQAFDDGVISGMASKKGLVSAAGAAVGQAAVGGWNTATDTHSPSRVARRQARFFGVGAVLGLQDSAPAVQRAAADMAPSLPGPSGGGSGGRGGGPAALTINFNAPTYGLKDFERKMEQIAREVFGDSLEDISIALGATG